MKKNITIVIFLALAAMASLFLMRQKTTKTTFAVEWHEITEETRSTMLPILEQLESVYVKAFLPLVKPYVYANDPRFANIPAEQEAFVEEKVVTGITESLRSGWSRRINQLYTDLQNKHLSAAHVAIAKDDQQKAIGFALLKEKSIKDHLNSRLLSIIEGSREEIDSAYPTHDEIYVALLAVTPGTQKKGIGKTLLFSVFDHLPHIKKMYLTTSANDFNKNTRGFYEHIGFTKVLKGVFTVDEDEGNFGREKIVYLYQKI